MNQALEMTGGLLPFLQIQPTEIFDINWAPQLESSLLSLMGGEEDSENIADFVAVAHYVIRNPHPPWVTEVPYPLSGFNPEWKENLNTSPLPELEPMAYFGAAAILLMAMECDEKALLGDGATHKFGPLYDLYPYAARRWRINLDQELPDLRVPSGFRKMFINWAESKVNFVEQPTQSK